MKRSYDVCDITIYDMASQPAFTCSKLTKETLEQRCEICSKLTIKTPKRRLCSILSIVNFEHVIAGWVADLFYSKSTQTALGHSKSTWALGHTRHLGTQGPWAVRHLGTRRALRHSDT